MAPASSLRGYFDEAGHPSDPNVHAFVIAGGIGEEDGWRRLDEEWSGILEEENVRDSKGVRWCHWRDLRHARGAFRGWDAARVDSFSGHLRTTIQNHVRLVIAAFDVFETAGLRGPVDLLWVAEWSVGTLRRALSLRRRPPPWVGMGIRCVLMAALLLVALRALRWEQFEDHGPKAVLLKEVGTWLDHYRPGPKRVMTMYPQVVYYARGTHLLMPYAEAFLALRYIHLKHPDFIALTEEETYMAPTSSSGSKRGSPTGRPS